MDSGRKSGCACRYDKAEFERGSSEKNNERTSEILEEINVDDCDEKSDQQKNITSDSKTLNMSPVVPPRRRSGTGYCLHHIPGKLLLLLLLLLPGCELMDV